MGIKNRLVQCFTGLLCLGHSLAFGGSSDNLDSYLDYKLDNGRYAVVYVEHSKTSPDKAKEKALSHADEVANKNGYRYFTVETQQNVQVAQGQQSNQMPGNMYQELIIDKSFDRKTLEESPSPNAQMYPGLKLVIKCYQDNPGGAAYDTCKWVSCKK